MLLIKSDEKQNMSCNSAAESNINFICLFVCLFVLVVVVIVAIMQEALS